MTPSEQTRWFAEEVQPHERAMRVYLLARFPSLSDHDDVVQEAYTRLLRAKAAGQVRYAKALLFTTARNAALDLFRRRRVPLESVTDFKELAVLDEQPDVAEQVGHSRSSICWPKRFVPCPIAAARSSCCVTWTDYPTRKSRCSSAFPSPQCFWWGWLSEPALVP